MVGMVKEWTMAGKGTPSKLSLKKKTRPLPEVIALNLNLIESLKSSSGESGWGEVWRIVFFGNRILIWNVKAESATLLENLSSVAVKEAKQLQTIEAMLCDPDFTFHVLAEKTFQKDWGPGRWQMFAIGIRPWRFVCLLILLSSVILIYSGSAKKSKINRNRQNRHLGRCFFTFITTNKLLSPRSRPIANVCHLPATPPFSSQTTFNARTKPN